MCDIIPAGTLQERELITPISAPPPSLFPSFLTKKRVPYFIFESPAWLLLSQNECASGCLTLSYTILDDHPSSYRPLTLEPTSIFIPSPALISVTARDYPEGRKGTPLTVLFEQPQSILVLSLIYNRYPLISQVPHTYVPTPQFLLLGTVLLLKRSKFTITLSLSFSWLLGNPTRPIPLCNNNYNDISLSPPPPPPWSSPLD